MTLVCRLILQKWQWKLDLSGSYLVCGAYQLLTSHDSHKLDAASDLIWQRQVSIFVWRLFRDRLPTKENLVVRGIIPHEAQLCVIGCGGVETTQHLFLFCNIFSSLWNLVRSWISFSSLDLQHISAHFVYSTGGFKARRSFLQLIWLSCV